MNKDKIIEITSNNLALFEDIQKDISYELRGIFASEALLIISLAKYFNVNLIVESGRARGYSTKIFAEFFKDESNFKIVSIDFDKNSQDSKYSEEKLKGYKNVSLIYGDSKEILSDYFKNNCVVFIDGPKGDDALFLAADAIKNEKVKAVFIHDLHKNTFHRNICETIFSNTFFSDDKDFVDKFNFLDKKCWKKLEGTGEAPYTRKGKKIDSYASTIGVIFQKENPINETEFLNYKNYYNRLNNFNFSTCFRNILEKIPFVGDLIIKSYHFVKNGKFK